MQENTDKLIVLWTSRDKETAENMVFMYALNSRLKGWWDEVALIIWGPSAKLASEDADIRDHLKKMKDAGVELLACKACADRYGVSDALAALGVDVKYMGDPLTRYLKAGLKVITI